MASDTHSTSVELFEGVHTLINTESRISRNSKLWTMLFSDPEIDKRESWREGIDGFGLPFGDTIFLYQESLGVFEGFDYNEERQHVSLGKIPSAMFRRQVEKARYSTSELCH